jgi:hypothetical protein
MENVKRSETQLKYIELNKKFLQEVEKGTSWDDLQPLLDEMTDLAKDIEDIEATNVFIMNPDHEQNRTGINNLRNGTTL